GHDQLTTYGIGKDLSAQEWTLIGRALLQQGLLEETHDGYPILRLNHSSLEILRQQRTVEIPALPVRQQKVKEPLPTTASTNVPSVWSEMSPLERGLFRYLREVRKALADEQSVSAYII